MSGLRRSWTRRTAQIAAAGLLAASGTSFFASTAFAAAGGNNGTVLINGQDFSNGNDPHISCPITFKWSGFDAGVADDYTITFTGQNPTGGTIDAGGVAPLSSNQTSGSFVGPDHTASPAITITGGKPNNKGEYHVTIVVETKSAANTDTKSKTVWLGGCSPAAPNSGKISFSGSCTTPGDVNSGYTWAITATADPGAPAASFPAAWNQVGGPGTGNFTIVDGTDFFTGKGINSVTVAPNPALPAGWTLTQPTAVAQNPCGNAPTPASATATADCNALTAHLVAASDKDTKFDIVHNGVSVSVNVAKGQTQDESYASGANETITVSVGGTQLVSKTSSNSCGNPGVPTPASATATADCSGLSAHLDGGTNGDTFTVGEPGGSHQIVVGPGATDDVSYASGNGAVITVSDAGGVLDTASAPTNCTAAAPQVTEANHCVSGMNLTLSNMNGSADETFTVVEPDGTTEQVLVRAGQLKKLVFAIKEDTTGTLSVTGAGMAKQSFAYHKNCATVLGVKHTRKPTHKPPTVVKGEHAQLPFTGFDTKRALLDGAVVFFLGAVLCILGARRKEEEPLYY